MSTLGFADLPDNREDQEAFAFTGAADCGVFVMPQNRGPVDRLMAACVRRFWRLRHEIDVTATRALDIVGALIAMVLLSPFLVVTVLAIRLESPGPILFRQVRIGERGRRFVMLKFRSRYIDAEERKAALLAQNETGGVIFKMKNDPRITQVGRVIRKASIDELPQLWNVLRGDMRLVGPRPPLPMEVEHYGTEERRRLEGPPGITGPWQVNGRSNIPFRAQVRLDIEYLVTRSVLGDLWLIARTIPAVLTARGAY